MTIGAFNPTSFEEVAEYRTVNSGIIYTRRR